MRVIVTLISGSRGGFGWEVKLVGGMGVDELGEVIQSAGTLVLHRSVLVVSREENYGGETTDVELGRNLQSIKEGYK